MAFSTTNLYFVFLLNISSDHHKSAQLQCTPTFMLNVHLNKQTPVKIVIKTLELALATVNYFRKETPSYLFDSVLGESKKRLDFEKIFAYRITQVTFFQASLKFHEISWNYLYLLFFINTLAYFSVLYTMSKLHFEIQRNLVKNI